MSKETVLQTSESHKVFLRMLENYAKEHNIDIENDTIYIHAKARKDTLQEIVNKMFEK